jgi:DNA-binding response OmpR family regulator
VLRRLRAGEFAPEANPRLRALWMSPNGELGDVLRGFQAGADDVIRTPFAYPEFRARVQALTYRDLIETPGVIEYRELRIDTAAHEVRIGATSVVVCVGWSTRCSCILRATLPASTQRTICCGRCGGSARAS